MVISMEPQHLNEYELLVLRMNTPRVIIDNATSNTATLIQVDSARNHTSLLDTVQVLTDLNLSVCKAYISSDGPYFMDVFHVTDHLGRKLTDGDLTSYIQHSIQYSTNPVITTTDHRHSGDLMTALELTGVDRPGLLSEVFAVLSDLNCVVTQAKIWTHNGHIASIISIENEEDTESRLSNMELRLRHVVQGRVNIASSSTASGSFTGDRRLHQMMFNSRDYETGSGTVLNVTVENLIEKGYSIVNVDCRDRPKLLFDVVCSLTDMEYVVFHGNVDTSGDRANQEFYVRHTDGTPISSEAERQRVIQCLQAAIERRSYDGLSLEVLCTVNDSRDVILSEVTRVFREDGLLVKRAEVSCNGEAMTIIFYVTDAAGSLPDASTIDVVRARIGVNCNLQVREEKIRRNSSQELLEGDGKLPTKAGTGLFNLGSIVLRNLYNLGLIRSCS